MSIIETISIQGIRSFDPRNPQVLDFLKPVTLILGQNGTGKTTIIECLKYATTGDLPPGSKLGGSFVHDPKIAGETVVKAKVSLKIKNLKGDPLTISRALQATQKEKNKQVSCQTLDSSILRCSGGEYISISSKCTDINFEITNNLGVTKAVLENVIFCHQEDSNWPLSEAKLVKERFDDLFASTRYVKALDSIRKIKTEKEANIKLYKVEINHLKGRVDYVNKKLAEQDVLESKSVELGMQCDELKQKLSPIEDSIQKYNCQYKELCEIEKKKDILKNEKHSNEARICELKENISEETNYTAMELEQLITESDLNLSKLKNSIYEEERKSVLLGKDISLWRDTNQAFLLEKGALNSKIMSFSNLEKNLNTSMRQLVDEISLKVEEFASFTIIRTLNNHLINMASTRDKDLRTLDEKLQTHQVDLELKKSEKTKIEHEIEINKRNLKTKQTDLLNFESKLMALAEDSAKLNTIKEQLITLNSHLVSFKDGFDEKSVREAIEKLSQNTTGFENKLEEIANAIMLCQKEEAIHTEINNFKKQKLEKQSAAKRIRSRHSESLEKLFDNNIPDRNIKRSLDKILNDLRCKNNQSQSSLTKLNSQIAVSETELKQIGDQIANNQKLVKEFEEDVYEICGHFELGNNLTELREKKRSLEDEFATIQSGISLYRKFKDILTKNKSDCPLCHREFNHESEVDDLIEEINDKCTNIPSKIENINLEMTKINRNIESLIKLDSQSNQIVNLKEKVLKNLESQLDQKKEHIRELKTSSNALSNERKNNVELEEMAGAILGDVANMEKYNDEVDTIDKDMINLKQKINHSLEEFRTKFELLQADKKNIQAQLLEEKRELEGKRKFLEDSLTKENKLTTQINLLENEKLKIQNVLQEFSNCHFQRETFKTEIQIVEGDIQSSKERLGPVNDGLLTISNICSNISKEKKLFEADANKKISELKARVESIDKTSQEVNRLKQENLQDQLETIERKIADLTNKIEYNTSCQNECKSRIDDLNSKIGNYQIRQRELQDSLKIRQHQVKIDDLSKQIEKLEIQLTNIDLTNMSKEVGRLENERRILKEQMDRFETQKIKTTTEIEIIKKDLSSEQFSGVDSNYLEKLYKMKASETAILDLDKYYKALDKAILTYHQSKMAEVNKILKELWRNTYSGKDIDYLEICSDEDTSSTSSKRRNYNYRVVMVKLNHGARLDMRGRCSAGQKVLASILIRLALAEVFCLHCGVLALDEPTTNLDQENIASLAYALVEIIKTRSKQKNFQLIVITHDEDFVQLLGRSEFIDQFYKIKANSSGHSEIDISGL